MNQSSLPVAVQVFIYPTEKSGRTIALCKKYRCLVRFSQNVDTFYDCQLVFENQESVSPGEEVTAKLQLLLPCAPTFELKSGLRFYLFEGKDYPQGEGRLI